MKVFHAWYYTWSPSAARYELRHQWFLETARLSVYPLIGILLATEQAYALFGGELGALLAGAVATSLIGLVYFGPITLLSRRLRTATLTRRQVARAIGVVTAVAIGSILWGSAPAIMAATSLYVLAILTISAIWGAKAIRAINKIVHTRIIRRIVPAPEL